MKNELDVEKDQYVLMDKKILQQEIEKAKLSKKDRVIEIGAGPGNLTGQLMKKAGKVLAFEIDKRFGAELEKLDSNVKLVYGNALEHSWEGYNKIVSNIPYSLSEPLIWKSISDKIELLVLVVGENFKKILLSKDTKVGILAGLFFDAEPLTLVKKECFKPVPKTDSWLIQLKRKKQTKTEKMLGRILLSECKTKNAIVYSLVAEGKTKKQAREILSGMNIHTEVLEKPAKKITGKFILRLRDMLEKCKDL